MTDRDLMQQAFDAMSYGNAAEREAARLALRERLAQPEQPSDLDWWKARAIQAERLVEKFGQPEQEPVAKWDASAPLVVHPHPAFQAAPPQPEQKPVAWMVLGDGEYGEYTPGMHFDTVGYKEYWERRGYELQPLYTAPPQRKPLLASDIVTMYDENPRSDSEMIAFARAIEAAHGIKGEA